MDSMIRIQILYEAVYISLHVNPLVKGMNCFYLKHHQLQLIFLYVRTSILNSVAFIENHKTLLLKLQ